jgi:hypothetical protein
MLFACKGADINAPVGNTCITYKGFYKGVKLQANN